MANLTIRSNNASRAFSIQQKTFAMPFNDSSIELVITPRQSSVIKAKDFKTSFLPIQISSVSFEDLGNNIIATVYFKGEINSGVNMNIDVPIFGRSTLKIDSFKIIETENISGEVLTDSYSPYSKSIIDNKVIYSASNNLDTKTLVLTKTFFVTNNYKFTKSPSYTISGNADRYQVIKKFKKNNKKEIISKTFEFYYTSPSSITSTIDTTINFTAYANDLSKQVSELVSTNLKENKIYSINQGIDPGPLGGSKRITVRGVPGSTFSFLVSNSNGEIYDKDEGAFTTSGRTISGIIPKAVEGFSYGESIMRINIPRASVATTITTKFIKAEDPEIQTAKVQAAIQKAIDLGESGDIAQAVKEATSDVVSIEKEVTSLTTPTLTFGVTIGNFLGPTVKITNSSGATVETNQVYLGDEGSETLKITKAGTYAFKFVLTSTGRVQIVRQPIFVMPGEAGTDNFVVDGGTPSTAQKLGKLASDGSTAIVSDWNWGTVQKDANIKITASVTGYGRALGTETVSGTDLYSYSEVSVYGEITVSNVGTSNDSVDLNLNNFLTRKDV